MNDGSEKRELDVRIRRALASLARRIRRYTLGDGLASVVAWLALAFWCLLWIDSTLEPIAAVRVLLLVAVGVIAVQLLFTRLLSPMFQRLDRSDLAMIIERKYPEFDEKLLTAVELTRSDPNASDASECNPEMLARVHQAAADQIAAVNLRQCFDPLPLRRIILAAVLLTVSVGVYAHTHNDAMQLWLRRTFLLSGELWPRNTQLTVEGFPDGVAKVARGRDLDMLVHAGTHMPLVPKTVTIHARAGNRRLDTITMSRQGDADPAVDPYQDYVHTFTSVLTPMTIDVYGGDTSIRGLKIEVVDSPTLVDTTLLCEYPEYMDREPATIPISGVTAVPEGCRLTLQARTNKPMLEAEVVYDATRRLLVGSSAGDSNTGDSNTGEKVAIEAAEQANEADASEADVSEMIEPSKSMLSKDSFDTIRLPMPELTANRLIEISLLDADGIRTRQPIEIALAMVDDQPPQVTARLLGIGSAVTPEAQLPVRGTVIDDYGVDRVWFDLAVDENLSESIPIYESGGNVTERSLDEMLDLQAMQLKAGQTLSITVKAADRYTLGTDGKPHQSSGDQWVLSVVTPQQLLAMLEAREIVLRQRFESLIADVEMTRDSFELIEFSKTIDKNENITEDADSLDEPASTDNTSSESATNDSTPGEGTSSEHELTESAAQHDLAIRTLRVQRAQRDSIKQSYETQSMSRAFGEIREELINNRIYTEERKKRLENEIVGPLDRIVDTLYPELDRRLYDLENTIANEELGPRHRDLAKQQLDEILRMMYLVRDRMVEMESFNEAVELLRAIIEKQHEIREQTKQRQKDKLRDLLGGGL